MITLARLFDALGPTCCYCGCETYVPGGSSRQEVADRFGITLGRPGAKLALRRRMASREHIVRVVDGGTNAIGNLAIACRHCNGLRNEATPREHRAAVQRLIAAGAHPNHADVTGLSKNAQWRMRRDARLACAETAPASGEGVAA